METLLETYLRLTNSSSRANILVLHMPRALRDTLSVILKLL